MNATGDDAWFIGGVGGASPAAAAAAAGAWIAARVSAGRSTVLVDVLPVVLGSRANMVSASLSLSLSPSPLPLCFTGFEAGWGPLPSLHSHAVPLP